MPLPRSTARWRERSWNLCLAEFALTKLVEHGIIYTLTQIRNMYFTKDVYISCLACLTCPHYVEKGVLARGSMCTRSGQATSFPLVTGSCTYAKNTDRYPLLKRIRFRGRWNVSSWYHRGFSTRRGGKPTIEIAYTRSSTTLRLLLVQNAV